ncbi:MAG: hypothetical protein EA349_04250 [Halomonadaceae bacterium]|nr:MAG: hypothetical protein EA349_04250 [Halomonadaceae bacterium]
MGNNAGNPRFSQSVTPLLLSALLAIPAAAVAEEREALFKGEVFARDSGELVYTEYHEQQGSCEGNRFRILDHQVRYEDPDGEVFAVKTLNYQESAQRPSYTIEDMRYNEKMEVINGNDRRLDIRWKTPDGDEKTFNPRVKSNGVVDAGFEALAQEYWDELVNNGERIRIDFLASTRGKFYDFEVRKTDAPSGLTGDYAFSISSRGWVTRWFVDEIIVGYDQQRRLTDYMGLTNIRQHAHKDENYDAHIQYQYATWPDCAG